MDYTHEEFLQDLKLIRSCKPKESLDENKVSVSEQHAKFIKFKDWLSRPICDKIFYLDKFTEEDKKTLIGLWNGFEKWINVKSKVVFLKINSEWRQELAPEDDNQEKQSCEENKECNEPTEADPKKTSPTPETSPTTSGKKSEATSNPPVNNAYLRYTAEIGIIAELSSKLRKERSEEDSVEHDSEVSKKKVESHSEWEDSEDTPVVRKVHQTWFYEFFETVKGTYYKRCIKRSYPDSILTDPTPYTQSTKFLGENGVVHHTAETIMGILRDHENLVEQLDINVKYWSNRFPIHEKFRYIRRLTVVHNSPSSTHWWMSRIDTMKTIPEVTILPNYDGVHPIDEEYRKGSKEKFKLSEAMPYVISFEERAMPIWVNVIPYCENPIFWARKLTLNSITENPLSDLARMSSLGEMNMNRYKVSNSELNKFVRMWDNGEIGHHLERVAIHMECSTKFTHEALNGVHYWDITDTLKDEDFVREMSDFTEAVQMENAEIYLLRRKLSQVMPRKYVTRGTPKYLNRDTPIESNRSPIGWNWASSSGNLKKNEQRAVCDAFAVLQLPHDHKHIYFTAVRNQMMTTKLNALFEIIN